jgi:hypothetical protein
MTRPIEHYERSQYEACMDARYQVVLHDKHVRFYKRARAGITFISLAGGSTALVGAVGNHPTALAIAGFGVALVSFLDVSIDFAARAAEHGTVKKRYLALLRKSGLSLEEFDAELLRIDEEEDVSEIDALRMPAYNENVRNQGREECQRAETRWQRFMGVIA